jgi:molybdopterin molybdotransferase
MTGAAIPRGANAVVPQEQAEINKAKQALIHPAKHHRHQHLRFAGEDIKKGETAIPAGTLLRPAHIGLLASLGVIEVPVCRRLRIAFFSTGDELKTLGEPLQHGEIYDSNRYTLLSMLRRMGFDALDFGAVADNPAALAETIDAAAKSADAIISSGGVSVGEADYVRDILSARGEVLFWKVAMKPGRPLAYGKLAAAGGKKKEIDFFGLPGNPVSVMVCFYQFVREALWRRAGRRDDLTLPSFYAKCEAPLKKIPGRTEFQRGVLRTDASGEPIVQATGAQGSGILNSMARANCLIILPEESAGAKAGEKVPVQMFEGLV